MCLKTVLAPIYYVCNITIEKKSVAIKFSFQIPCNTVFKNTIYSEVNVSFHSFVKEFEFVLIFPNNGAQQLRLHMAVSQPNKSQ